SVSTGGWVGGYSSATPDDGSASGPFRMARATEPARMKLFPQILGTEGSDAIAWLPDGGAALVEGSAGLYRVPTDGEPPEIVFKSAMLAGLAVDQSGANAAFWVLQRDRACLEVKSVASMASVRSWCMPTEYGGDLDGFEIGFSGSSILARTYDRANATPLKRFDLASGKVTTVVPNLHAVGFTPGGVFFAPEGQSESGLYRLAPAGGVPRLIAPIRCDAIAASPDGRHVLCQLFGEATRSVLFSGPALSSQKTVPCRSSAALDDEYLYCAIGGTITRVAFEPVKSGPSSPAGARANLGCARFGVGCN